MAPQVLQALFEHRQVQARGPAETFYPGQEAPGGDGRGLRVEQTREDLVVEDALGVQAVHHRLEIEQQAAPVRAWSIQSCQSWLSLSAASAVPSWLAQGWAGWLSACQAWSARARRSAGESRLRRTR